MGGQRTLQRKWTSFMKARLDCSLPELSLPPIVQDVFLLKHDDWRKNVFYAVFISQSYVVTVKSCGPMGVRRGVDDVSANQLSSQYERWRSCIRAINHQLYIFSIRIITLSSNPTKKANIWLYMFCSRSMSQVSTVCAYSVRDIRNIFSGGKFKTPVAVETSHIKWVMYTGEMPVPRPGAVSPQTYSQKFCI